MNCLTWLALLVTSVAFGAEFSITMDDFDIHEQAVMSAKERNVKILSVLESHKAKAALFVTGKNIRTRQDRGLLKVWSDQGHVIGNHTYSHNVFGKDVSIKMEQLEILRAERVLCSEAGFEKIFRFPMRAQGDTPQKRDKIRAWLKERGYRVGSITIDNSDWFLDQRMRERIRIDPKIDLKPYRIYYLDHLWERAQYYNDLSKKVVGREVKHTLLLHFNLLNALFLNDVLNMFESKGWKIIDAKVAFQDPIFDRLPNSMPAGQNLLWDLAKESGQHEMSLRYPAEDPRYEKSKMEKLGL